MSTQAPAQPAQPQGITPEQRRKAAEHFGEELTALLKQQAEADSTSAQLYAKLATRLDDLFRISNGGMLATPADRDLVKAMACHILHELNNRGREEAMLELFLPTLERSLASLIASGEWGDNAAKVTAKAEHLVNLIKLCARAHRTPFLPEDRLPQESAQRPSGLILPGQSG